MPRYPGDEPTGLVRVHAEDKPCPTNHCMCEKNQRAHALWGGLQTANDRISSINATLSELEDPEAYRIKLRAELWTLTLRAQDYETTLKSMGYLS